jgi:glutamyl-tRNA synthetase
VGEYERQGYLPEAMTNFLALLGWSPGGDQEVMSRDELITRFAIEGISGGNAVFNPEKLDWFNQQHIMRLSGEQILARLGPDLAAAGLVDDALADRARTVAAIDLVKPRAKRLPDIVAQLRPFISNAIDRDSAAVAKYLAGPDLESHLAVWRDRLAAVEPFDAAEIEAALRALAAERGIKAGVLIHATRVAVTGQAVSPGLFDVLVVAGRERVLRRLDGVIRTGAD